MAFQHTLAPIGDEKTPDSVPGRSHLNEDDAATHASTSRAHQQETFSADFRNVRLPTFWHNQPGMWFVQLENEFAVYRIRADETKYSAIIRHLDQDAMTAVADVLSSPPPQDKYVHLKRTLMERFTDSEEKNLRTLLRGIELGDKRPSALLRDMRTLAGSNATEGLLRTLWMQRLPARIQELLTVLDKEGIEKQAELADKALEQTSYSVAATSTSSQQDDAIRLLTQRFEEFSKSVLSILQQRESRADRHQRARSKSRSRSTSRPNNSGQCYYHQRFGNKARKCQPPCTAQSANSTHPIQGNADSRLQ